MLIRRLLFVVFMSLPLLHIKWVTASVLPGSDAEALAAILKTYITVSADFTQYTADKSGQVLQETQGKLVAKRPGYFYWRVLPPLEQVIVSDGHKVLLYDPDLEQATIQKQSDRLGNTPALLLSGEVEKLKQAYDIVHIIGEQDKETFILRPRENESLFETLRLVFIDKQLKEMRLKDALGQRSVLVFLNLKLNETIPDKQFTFELPEGVDIIQDQMIE